MKQALIYSLKIWLTTFLIAPILVTILLGIQFDTRWLEMLFAYPRLVLGGLIPLLLSAGILLEAVYFIKKRSAIRIRKIYFTIVTILATAFSFYLISGRGSIDKGLVIFFIPYTLINIAGIWLFKLKPTRTVSTNTTIN